jgi:hypothetical protein
MRYGLWWLGGHGEGHEYLSDDATHLHYAQTGSEIGDPLLLRVHQREQLWRAATVVAGRRSRFEIMPATGARTWV